jgi:hypothetical protein
MMRHHRYSEDSPKPSPRLPSWAKCALKVITNTRTKLEQERTCASPSSTTKARFEAKDAEHFIGAIERTGTGSGGPGNVRVELAGRWASASCKGFVD